MKEGTILITQAHQVKTATISKKQCVLLPDSYDVSKNELDFDRVKYSVVES